MFKQVFRVAFVTLVWKQYKAAILSTLLLVVYLLLVKKINADMLLAKTQSGTAANIGLSIALKWLAYTIGIVIYVSFHTFRGLRPKPQTLKDKAKEANIVASEDEDDPFASIRERKVLRSRADFLDGKD
jgi:hypothetical protein